MALPPVNRNPPQAPQNINARNQINPQRANQNQIEGICNQAIAGQRNLGAPRYINIIAGRIQAALQDPNNNNRPVPMDVEYANPVERFFHQQGRLEAYHRAIDQYGAQNLRFELQNVNGRMLLRMLRRVDNANGNHAVDMEIGE